MTTETTITEDAGSDPEVAELHILVMSPEGFASHPVPASGELTLGRSSRSVVQIDDPMASREHARIYVRAGEGGPAVTIEDVGSANGTHVRDAQIAHGERIPIAVGEAIMVGSTVIMVLQSRSHSGARRLWSHTHFEVRVDDECARAAKSKKVFALARLRLVTVAAWAKVLPLFASELTPPHVLAKYGPQDYEFLFVDASEDEVDGMVRRLIEGCRRAGLDANWGVAWYPRDGRTGDALLAMANALLSTPPGLQPRREHSIAPMERVRAMAARAAQASINVLILGENGVGKDVLAQLVHSLSPQRGKPFVPLNCASLSETLMDSELFGHGRGAFTGATAAHVGVLESANGGTVFLDEIGDMPKSMQAKLLRVIETREVRPVGAPKTRPIDVRFISATNKDLEAATATGEFRIDLLHRLNSLTLTVPPLRDRRDEIVPLATTFVQAACRQMGRDIALALAPDVVECLLCYAWPGNIRELKNVMERAVVLCDGPEIELEHLPLDKMRSTSSPWATPPPPGRAVVPTVEITKDMPRLADPEQEAERRRIIDALVLYNGNQTRAARYLEMPRRTFVSKLDYYGIPRPQKGAQIDDVTRTMTMLPVARPADEPEPSRS